MQQTSSGSNALVMPIAGIVIGLVLVILAQFFLDKLADSSDTWHWIQHGVLFVGGIVLGAGGTLLWASGQQRA